MKINQSAPVTAQAADAQGHPTGDAFDGPLSWSVDHPEIATLTPAADGLSAVLAGVSPGSVVVSAAGQVQGQSVSGTLNVQIVDVSTQILLTLGTPTP